MKKLSRRMLYAVTILGMLTILTVSGGIYVSSTTNQSPQNLETSPITLHTNAENNVLQWNITWGGAGQDEGRGVAVDANGFIYCTGTINWGTLDEDLALVKFAPNGTKLWNTTWGPGAGYGIVVDASGAIYCIGGTSFGAGGGDLALIKFAPNGTKLWNTTWGNAFYDIGYGVAVDANGSIYCTGETYTGSGADDYSDLVLLKFAPNGTRLWNTSWGGHFTETGNGVAVDANGSIYCIGTTVSFSEMGGGGGNDDYDLALVKFAPNGTRLWNITKNVFWGDFGYGVAVDASGSIYCTGEMNSNFGLFKFAPTGKTLWETGWSFGPGYTSSGKGVALDASGFIYCCGKSGKTNFNFALLKFAPNSTRLWNLTWGGAWNEICYGVAVDASGSIYCTGENNVSSGTSDMVLFKFITPPEAPVLDPISPAFDEDGIIALNWSDVVGVDKYYIYRELSNITSIAGLHPKYVVTESNYTDTLTKDDTYYYVIVAAAGAVNSTISNCESVTFITPPEAPVLDPISPAFDEDGIIALNWSEVVGVEKYYIYRELSNITSVAGLQPKYVVTESNYTDTLTNDNTYYYVIVAVIDPVNSTLSNCESVTVIIPPEGPILDPISPAFDEDGIIELNWNDVEWADEYYIYRELSPITSVAGLTPKWHVPQSNYTDFLSNDDTYYYVIVAVAGSVNSTISNCESVTVSISQGIPGFELVSLLISVLALVYLAHRRRLYRSIS